MRGKRSRPAVVRCAVRNIPAYAGKTHRETVGGVDTGEHPRVCGENLLSHNNLSDLFRNIPAYAGKT